MTTAARPSTAELILQRLDEVGAERSRRAGDPLLAARVTRIKQYQHARFRNTYSDLLVHPQYAGAVRFFLNDLYGPMDFEQRDDQFARIVPGLVRLFPRQIVQTVLALVELHALSEQLDTAMAQALGAAVLDAKNYGIAWRQIGHTPQRGRQIELMLAVGTSLDRYTRNPLLRHTLRAMRAPAQAAGLAALQQFLERGFDTFRAMGGAAAFLAIIAQREREFSAELFRSGGIAT